MSRQLTDLERAAESDGFDLNELRRLSTLASMWAWEAKEMMRKPHSVLMSGAHRNGGCDVSRLMLEATEKIQSAIDEFAQVLHIPN